MDKDFVPSPESIELKELGFDKPCFGYYDNTGKLFFNTNGQPVGKDWVWVGNQILPTDMILAPTFSQAFRFFREKYGLKHDIDDDNIGMRYYYRIKSYTDKFDNYDDIIKHIREEKDWVKIEFKTYEEAELACLRKLIEIVKQKQKNENS